MNTRFRRKVQGSRLTLGDPDETVRRLIAQWLEDYMKGPNVLHYMQMARDHPSYAPAPVRSFRLSAGGRWLLGNWDGENAPHLAG